MRVFRLHIRPKGGLALPAISFAYCLREQVLGVGWQVAAPPEAPVSWELYERLATEQYGLGNISRVRFLHDHVGPDDLIWTRDTEGKYYLARVRSRWEYLDTPDGRDADIVNIVRCRLLRVPQADDVPGKVVACFRPNRTIQPVTDATALTYSCLLWNQLAASADYTVPAGHHHNLFAYLDSETIEDVIFIYLQCEGWIIIPNSRKADTMAYEFVAIHRSTHERALVQVKTGNTPLNAASWADFREKVFLFQAGGFYVGNPTPNVVMLAPATVENFMRNDLAIMPRAVQRWSDFIQQSGR